MLSLLTSNVYFSAQQFETAENQLESRARLHSLVSSACADTEEHDDPESTEELEETDKESAHACCSLKQTMRRGKLFAVTTTSCLKNFI